MKCRVHVRTTLDELSVPWPIQVENTEHPGRLTVQMPHPLEGDTLIGFERVHGEAEVSVIEEDWTEKAVGLSPVFVGGGEMYSVPTYIVTSVEVMES